MSGSSLPRGSAQRGGGLILITVIAVGTFAAGLFMFVRSWPPAGEQGAMLAVDAGEAPLPDSGVTLVETELATVPPGMLLVTGEGLTSPFFVARAAVSNAEYAQWQVRHKFATKDADRPVTGIPYDYAAQYARARGGRLLRADEWDHAIVTPSFVPAGMKLWEWVDEGDRDRKLRAVRGVTDRDEFRKVSGDATVTFRLAQDIPSASDK
jgi:hypothetical protein